MSFTNIKDLNLLILEKLDDEDLFNVCLTNKYGSELCENELFWRKRLKNRYPFLVQYKHKKESWKHFYLKMTFYINKIEEKWGIPYIRNSHYNPEEVYTEEIESENDKSIYLNVIPYVGEDGRVELMTFLMSKLDTEIDVDFNDDLAQALSEAAKYGNIELLTYLIEKQHVPTLHALFGAAQRSKELVDKLIEKYDIKILTMGVLGAIKANNTDIFKYFVNKGWNAYEKALGFSADTNNTDMIKYLLNNFNISVPNKMKALLNVPDKNLRKIIKIFIENSNPADQLLLKKYLKGR